MKLSEGQKAPDFTLADQDGKKHKLSLLKGKKVLLYFYPKDNTSGCTKEACSIRDVYGEFKKAGIVVLGVSTDTVESHKRFSKKYHLPFTILADEKKEVVKKYGVWGEKKFMGKTYMGTKRASFLIDARGLIKKIYENVKPEKHADEVLEDTGK